MPGSRFHHVVLEWLRYDLGQGGVNVSGGQKQRLCIARAMLKRPKILILDDSTSAVDSGTEAKIRESFYKDFASTTIFIIAQRISSVRDADQIIILDDGKIAGIGNHEELLAEIQFTRRSIHRSKKEHRSMDEKRRSSLGPRVMPVPRGGPGMPRGFERPKHARKTLTRLMQYLNKKKWALFIVIVLMLLSSSGMLVGTYFIKPLINNFILPGDFYGLARSLILLALIYLVAISASYLQNILMIRIAQRTTNKCAAIYSQVAKLAIDLF